MAQYNGPFPATISGSTYTSVEVDNQTFTGAVSNAGTLSGSLTGISVVDSTITGAIIDSGIIAPTQAGVFGIAIDNATTISGAATAISVTGPTFAGGISNAGNVTGSHFGIFIGGTTGAGAANVTTFTGGITNSGTISGGQSGINVANVSTFTGGISNSGTISGGSESGIYVDNGATFDGNIVNETGAAISAHYSAIGVYNVSAFDGGITNAGSITVGQNETGITVYQVPDFTGSIVNTSSGSISGTGAGAKSGISVKYGSVFGGGITNSGTITAQNSGIRVDNVLTFQGSIANETGGTISAGRTGIYVSSVGQFGSSTAAGNITNSGTISGGINSVGIGVYDVSNFSGDVGNSGTIAVSDTGIFLGFGQTFTGNISNSGSVTADYGIVVHGEATFAGNIVNATNGTISAFTAGIFVSADFITALDQFGTDNPGGGIVNAGNITVESGAGIAVGKDDRFFNPTSSTISAFSGGISNSGTISAESAIVVGGLVDGGSFTLSSFAGGIINSAGGAITATGTGIFVGGRALDGPLTISDFSGGITNSGAITASFGVGIAVGGAAQEDNAAVVVSAFTGGIVNSTGATISAQVDGILVGGTAFVTRFGGSSVTVSDFSGGITNNGTITVTSGAGIEVGGGIVTFPSSLFFSSAASVAISTFSGDIVNTGTISGVSGILVDDVATFSNDIVNATGGLIVATSGVGIQVGKFNFNPFGGPFSSGAAQPVASFLGGITNNGTISFSEQLNFSPGSSFARAGIMVGSSPASFTDILVSTFAGGLTNTGMITGVAPGSGTSVGIDVLVTHVSVFSGGITNSGVLSAVGAGIALFDDQTFTGDIVNQTTGTITVEGAGIEVEILSFAGNIINQGNISGNAGIALTSVAAFGTAAAASNITNSGTITAGNVGIGINHVATFDGGVTNTGTITGAIGIDLSLTAGISIFDSGVIVGSGGNAIELNPTSGTDTLTLAAGYTITGNVVGGGADTLQLGGSSAASFDFDNIGTQYTGFSTFEVTGGTWSTTGAGSNWTVEGGTLEVGGSVAEATVESGGTLGGTGTAGAVTVESGGTFAPGDPSTFTVGSLTLESGSNFDEEIGGTSLGTGGAGGYDQTVVESGGAISLGDATLNVSLVNGFTPSVGETFIIIDNETGSLAGGTFDGLPQGATLNIDGNLFQISYDGGSNGHDVTLTDAPCYCPGTLVRTPWGERQIEELKIGDEVMTASGEARPVKWIGKRSYSGCFVIGRKDILPVCIKAGAIEDHVPKRDLWVSPNHAMYFKDEPPGGVLIEAKDLINGSSIVQTESAETIEYFHVELDSHDVIIAEGALAESFIDDDSRFLFHNAGEYRALYPDAAKHVTRYCAPRVQAGYEVEAVWRRLAARAGVASAGEETRAGKLRGYVDRVTGECVAGWAQNVAHPEAPVCLDILVGGVLAGQVLANRYREDLKRAGIGSGCHSFEFTLPPEVGVALDEIEVRRSLDGAALELTIEAWRTLRQSAGRQRVA